MDRRAWSLAALAAVAAAATAVWAQDHGPAARPGSWSYSPWTCPAGSGGCAGQAISWDICARAKDFAPPIEGPWDARGCPAPAATWDGEAKRWRYSRVCRTADGTWTLTGEAFGDFQTKYVMTGKLELRRPGGPPERFDKTATSGRAAPAAGDKTAGK